MDLEDWFAGYVGRGEDVAEEDLVVVRGVGEEEGEGWFEAVGEDWSEESQWFRMTVVLGGRMGEKRGLDRLG